MPVSKSIIAGLMVGGTLSAGLVSEALLSFPAHTEYVEYDDLASLRRLANYAALRKRYSGKTLEEAAVALAQLGIGERNIQEIVSASSPTGFYGLAGGTFSGRTVAESARGKRFAVKLLDTNAFCTGRKTCILFPEDTLAIFGTLSQLKTVLQVRQGVITRLSSNRDLVSLLNGHDLNAPVRGVMFGGQLNGAISDMLQEWSGWKRDWSGLAANIHGISYSVRFDKSKAHVIATLECTSKTAAALLVQAINAIGALQSTGKMPLQQLQGASLGNIVTLKADTTVL